MAFSDKMCLQNTVFRLLTAAVFFTLCLPAGADDTIFTALPNARLWNPDYAETVFLDEFNGTKLNQDIWYVEQCKSRGYSGNNEGEPDNIIVGDGTLKLVVRNEPANIDSNCWNNSHFVSNYTSAEIISLWHRYKYGVFEARCLMPRVEYFAYAYWLWGPGGNGYPSDGLISEIDIAEGTVWSDGTNHEMKSAFHCWTQSSGELMLPEDFSVGYGTTWEGAWHIFKIEWNPYQVIFLIDDIPVWLRTRFYSGQDTVTSDVPIVAIDTGKYYNEREYFPNDHMATVFQNHLQRDTSVNVLPSTVEVDYVKVSRFFEAPEISCPDVVYEKTETRLDVDSQATAVSWCLYPAWMFAVNEGIGNSAMVEPVAGANGNALISYFFTMPSGEVFGAEKQFIVDEKTVSASLLHHEPQSQLTVVPNPSQVGTTICFTNRENMDQQWKLEVYSPNHRLVLSTENLSHPNFDLKTSGWSPGVYIVRAVGQNTVLTEKLSVVTK